jgi:hypothetical protein
MIKNNVIKNGLAMQALIAGLLGYTNMMTTITVQDAVL